MSDGRQWYYFTFGCGQKFVGHYVKFYGTFDEARKKMFDEYIGRFSIQKQNGINGCRDAKKWGQRNG